MADRHQFRANWHPYDEGLYFVTICCADKRHLFGKIVGAQFIASTLGSLVKENIEKIPSYYNDVEIPNHVVMPNHIHMVISIATSPADAMNRVRRVRNFQNVRRVQSSRSIPTVPAKTRLS